MVNINGFFNLELMGVSLWIWFTALLVIVIAIVVILLLVKFKNRGVVVVADVKIKNSQHAYNKKELNGKDKEITVELLVNDFLLKRGVVYSAKEEEILLPGTYTILSAEENTDKFNIRLHGLVREYENKSSITIKEGEEICSISHTTILR